MPFSEEFVKGDSKSGLCVMLTLYFLYFMAVSFISRDRKTIVTVSKGVVIAIVAVVAFMLINANYFITPRLHFSYTPGDRAGVIHPEKPGALVRTADEKMPWRLIEDVFPFTVTVPRIFASIDVRVRLTPGTQDYSALKVLGKNGETRTKIISAAFLDSLSWPSISNENLTLWMRPVGEDGQGTQQYATVDEFLASPPTLANIGSVQMHPYAVARVQDYQPQTSQIVIPHSFRGKHTLMMYAERETLSLHFIKRDLNRKSGGDTLKVQVQTLRPVPIQNSSIVKSFSIADDGDTGNSGRAERPQEVSITIPNASGFYIVVLDASDDVLLQNLTTPQQYLTFEKRAWLADGPAYGQKNTTPLTLQTNGSKVTIEASHVEGLQVITVAGKRISLQETKKEYKIESLQGTSMVSAARGNFVISTDGFLAITPASPFLFAGMRNLDLTVQPNVDNLDYVVAPYTPNGTTKPEFHETFSVEDIGLTGQSMHFSIETPGMETNSTTIGLRDIDVWLRRGPLPWAKVFQKLSPI